VTFRGKTVEGAGRLEPVTMQANDALHFETREAGFVDIASGAWHSDRGKIRDHQMAQFYNIFCGKGYTVFAVRPGSRGRFTAEDMVNHVKLCIRWVKAHADEYGIDPNRITYDSEFKTIGQMQMDVMALALACGATNVATIQWGTGAGGPTFTWDGMTDTGTPADAGRYTFLAGFQADGEIEAAETLVSASVESVLFGADGFSVRLRGIGDMPFSAVREIREPAATPAPVNPGTATN